MNGQPKQIWRGFENKLKIIFEFIIFKLLPQKKSYKIAALMIVLIGIFVVGSQVYAADLLHTVLDLLNVVLLIVVEMLGWVLMKLFAVVIIISSFNDFVTNPAVVKGWVLVRDICNLFFVLILLLIAFAQIFQVEKYSLKALLPKLLIGAILVNFSKLIAGLIIDFGQVVMMTFVNGYAATAGANLVNGLGLAKLLALKDVGGVGTPESENIFIALFVAVFVLIISIVIVFFILLLLLLRIVYLWILVVISPIAFVFPAIPIAGFQGQASKWWTKFGWAVAVGPLMAFFLWLSLMVMANPDETISKSYEQVEAKSKGSVVSGYTMLNQLVQSAIGLAMLFGGLMIVQEAGTAMGGMFGSVASTAMKSATSVAKSVGRKMGGYGAVVDRSVAAYGGFAAKQKEKKALTMAKWSGYGEKAYAKKEAGIRAAKRVGATTLRTGMAVGAAAGVGAGMAGKWAGGKIDEKFGVSEKLAGAKSRIATAYDEAKAKVGGIYSYLEDKAPALKSAREGITKVAEKTAAAGKWVGAAGAVAGAKIGTVGKWAGGQIKGTWDQTAHVGGMNLLAEDRIDQEEYKKAMAEGEALLKARGVSNPEDLEKAMSSEDEDVGLRKAAALKLASMGKIKDLKSANTARDLMKGDRASDGALEESLLKKQAHLAFDTTGKDGKFDPESAGAKRLISMMREGAVDAGSQNESTYKDTDFMEMAQQALGDKVFSTKMQDVSKKSAKHKDAVAKSLTGMAVKRAQGGAPDGGEDFRKALANVTGNLNEAYGQRDADGQLKKIGDAVEFDNSLADEFKKFVRGLSGKQLAGMNIKEQSASRLAENVSPQQLANMATSDESGAEEKIGTIVEEIINQASASGDTSKVARIAANQVVMNTLGADVTAKIKGILDRVQADADAASAAAKATADATAKAQQDAEVAAAAAKAEAEKPSGISQNISDEEFKKLKKAAAGKK